ncbi:MAG: hypothetical protein KDA21_15765 [Phycisphaerales bacterium]|nr:hypothetical protein [Phycisphaerales bacterium]
MAHKPAVLHRFQFSLTDQDSTSAETTGMVVKADPGGANTPTYGGEEYVDNVEVGNDTFAPVGAPEELTKTWSKTISQPAADNAFLAHQLFYASHGGAASTEWTLDTLLSAQWWLGGMGVSAHTPKSFTMEDLGDPDNSDDAKNELVHNVVVGTFTMGSGVNSPVSATSQLIGGGLTASLGGAPTGRQSYRNNVFTHKHVKIVTSDTTGLGSLANFKTIWDNGLSDANATSYTGLTGTPSNWTDLIDSWELQIVTAYDLVNSMTLSLGYCPSSGYWRVQDQSATLRLTLKDGASEVGTLRTEYQNKTARPFEVKMIYPTALVAGSYSAVACNFPKMYPVANSWQPANAGRGAKSVSVTYRAHNDGTQDWRMGAYFGSGLSTTLGG